MEEQIAHLRAELLHKEQETQRVQLQLVKEKEERERAERKVEPVRCRPDVCTASLMRVAAVAWCWECVRMRCPDAMQHCHSSSFAWLDPL